MAGGRLILPIAEPVLNADGEPQSGALLYVYENGTTTLASIFADPDLETAIENPQTSNAAGRFYEQATEIWADTAATYTMRLVFGTTDLTFNDIAGLGASQSLTGYAPINSPAFTGTPTSPTPSASDNSTRIATTAYVQTNLTALTNTVNQNRLPSGAVSAYAGQTAPTGWLECNGALISRVTYAALFAVLGTTFGTGDGSTTFGLPDLRAEFVRGWDHGRGVDTGRVFGSSQADLVKDHTHTVPTANTDSGVGRFTAGENVEGSMNTGSMTSGGGAETRPRNVALMYIIKT